MRSSNWSWQMIIAVVALVVAIFALASCASTPARPQPKWTEVSTHLPDTEDRAEHDETQTEDGITTQYYPNEAQAQHIVYRFPGGGLIDSTCLTHSVPCPHWSMRVTGFNPNHLPKGFHIDMPEGTYTLTATTTPYVSVMKDDNQMTVGYWATNKNGRGVAVVKDYSYAKALVDLPR